MVSLPATTNNKSYQRWRVGILFVLGLLIWCYLILQHEVTSPIIQTNISGRMSLQNSTTDAVHDELLWRARSICDPRIHICHRRMSWTELSALLAANVPHYLSRLNDSQTFYQGAREQMRQEYRTVSDAVRHQKFGAPCTIEADGKRICVFGDQMSEADQLALKDSTALPDSVLVPNDFPYALEHPIRHEVIWTRVPLYDDTPRIKGLIEKYFPPDQWRTNYLVNPEYLQTIRDIFHIHVFVLPINETIT